MSKKVKVEFIKDGVSPTIGNIWIGRVCELDPATAQKFVASGTAKIYDGKESQPETDDEETKLSDMNMKELKILADDFEVEFNRKTKKEELIKLIMGKMEEAETDDEEL